MSHVEYAAELFERVQKAGPLVRSGVCTPAGGVTYLYNTSILCTDCLQQA